MAALDTIRTALAAALRTAPGLSAYERVPGQVNPPAAVVAPDGIEYDVVYGEGANYRLPIQFLVSLGDWAAAQRSLDGYISHDGTGVAAILTADVEVRVASMEEYGLVTFAGTDYLGAQLIVEVLA